MFLHISMADVYTYTSTAHSLTYIRVSVKVLLAFLAKGNIFLSP